MPVGPEYRLSAPAELLFRQASPGWIREGRPSAQLFRPRAVDHGLLSVDREEVVKTAAACLAAAKARGFKSAGVWAVSVNEVNGQRLEAYGDPTTNPAHTLIDMSQRTQQEQMAIADRLHAVSLQRGQQA